MQRFLSYFLLLPIVACFSLGAETAKDRKVKLSLLATTVPADLGQVCLVTDAGKSQEIELPVNNVSDPLEITGAAVQLKMVGKEIVLSRFTVPAEGRRFVVVFTPAKPSGYQAHVVRTDDPTFKRGDCFFLNLTSKIILGKLGTKTFQLEVGKSLVTRPAGAREDSFYDIAFAYRGEGGDRILSTSRWPVDEQIRSYVFFTENQEGGITYRAVDEFVMDEK